MTRVWQLMGLAGGAVAGLLVGVLVPNFPDSLILVLYLVAFFAILMAYSRWKDAKAAERKDRENESEAEFHRLYTRYTVERQLAYGHYRDERMYTHGEFTFPSFAEWREEGRAQIN
ncbi:hypothetical protein KDI96_gp37 [Arthrobacter phage Gisselle]|uniref:Uncharacterized protein n=1 Tax=Arthrobacter phage Gisselle TaxID=2743905 RepID=A0AAE7F9T7_9CAUD|nr:hypothetical protein KDI96_gp37 [Arthrobacter phage Gisselle]QDH48942.1 hypothetical protein SEA_DREAMTEAM_37 [Arthrobacter phage DreamTeam]QKY79343.1 hypothetical protein SEA_GISSELLE_37 [Arthrobacter phage Gisselle]